VLECVVNISEGRRRDIIDSVGAAAGDSLLDVHTDADHHRSVFTLASREARDVQFGARALARTVAKRLDVSGHEGVHPRLGALDVVPFVSLSGSTAERALAHDAATSFAQWWSSATNGTTSSAPSRGWTPSCARRSRCSVTARANACAAPMQSRGPGPASVNTDRW